MPQKTKRIAPQQILRAKQATAINQLLFAAWLLARILNAPLPTWANGNLIWFLLVIPIVLFTLPVMQDPRAAKQLRTPAILALDWLVAALMLIYFFQDVRANWFWGVFAVITIATELAQRRK